MEQIYLDDIKNEYIPFANRGYIMLETEITPYILLEFLDKYGIKEGKEHEAIDIKNKNKQIGTIIINKDKHPGIEQKYLWEFRSIYGINTENIDEDDGIYNTINGVVKVINENIRYDNYERDDANYR